MAVLVHLHRGRETAGNQGADVVQARAVLDEAVVVGFAADGSGVQMPSA
jgi:hypothetical protein